MYLTAVDQCGDQSVTLGNVADKVGRDSAKEEAALRGRERFGALFRTGGGTPLRTGDGLKKDAKWNGKDTPSATRLCNTFNNKFNPNAAHPAECLHPDGTCRFRHVCNQWVTGKGKNGMCEGDHRRAHCDNPNKCDKPAEQ